MIAAEGQAVVLGVGNLLRGDDGVGVRVVEELRRRAAGDPAAMPAGTRLVDGGTLGMDLLGSMRGARSVVLVDAVDLGQPAGSVSVLRGDEIAAAGGCGDGSRPGSIGELLAVARLMAWLPEPVALVGVQVADTSPGVGLSPGVAVAVPAAAEAAHRELCALDELAAAGRSTMPPTRRQGGATA